MTRRFTLKIGDHLLSAEKKKSYNREVFSEIAPKYDFITRALSFWNDASWKRDLIKALPLLQNPTCVDMACGTGDISFLLAEKYPAGNIIGIDIAPPMLTIAKQRNRSDKISFTQTDMSHTSLDSESVDIITGGYALRNAPDLSALIDEIHRILKPNGVAAFLDFSKSESPAFQKWEYRILKTWGGFWGVLLHGNHEVYSYIAESLKLYPDRLQLQEIFKDKGFSVVKSQTYFMGVTELFLVRKIVQ